MLLTAAALVAVCGAHTVTAQTAPGTPAPAWAQAPVTADKIQPKDSLDVTVPDQADLTRRYTVEQDGILVFPLVGSIPAAGLTAQQLATDLEGRLNKYLKNPHVRVVISRPKRVFVFGEQVKAPGIYELETNRTLLQALASAGAGELSEAVVIRTRGAISPVLPGQDAASEVIHVNLRDLEKGVEAGTLSGNIELQDGDTVFVPRVDPNLVQVVGQVRHPGAYAIATGTTVRQALTLAGGPAERAALERATITRIADGRVQTIRATLDDTLRPGDSVSVPELYRFPIVAGSSRDLSTQPENLWNHPPGELRLAPSLSLLPSFAIRRLGVDAVLHSSDGTVQYQAGIMAGPQLDLLLHMDRLRLRAAGTLDFSYYVGLGSHGGTGTDVNTGTGAGSVNPGGGLAGDYAFSRRLSVYGSWMSGYSDDYVSLQVDARGRVLNKGESVGIRAQASDRLTLGAVGQVADTTYDSSANFLNTSLHDTMSERVDSVHATAAYGLTARTSLGFEAAAATHRFPFYPVKNADATEFAVVTSFAPAERLSGTIRGGYLMYIPLASSAAGFTGPIGGVDLAATALEKTLVGVKAERVPGEVWQRQFAYAVVDRYGAYMRQGLPARFDARLEAYREGYHNQAFSAATTIPSTDWAKRYHAEIGRTVTRIGRVFLAVEYLQHMSGSSFPAYSTFRWWSGVSIGVRGGLTIANLQAGL
jgi:polysaccharide export outer membrane protein